MRDADQIVSLTEEGKAVLVERFSVKAPITVIPCCVDFDCFPPVSPPQRTTARELLGIAPDTKVAHISALSAAGT